MQTRFQIEEDYEPEFDQEAILAWAKTRYTGGVEGEILPDEMITTHTMFFHSALSRRSPKGMRNASADLIIDAIILSDTRKLDADYFLKNIDLIQPGYEESEDPFLALKTLQHQISIDYKHLEYCLLVVFAFFTRMCQEYFGHEGDIRRLIDERIRARTTPTAEQAG